MLSQEKWFYFANGKNAKDIPELVEALEGMSFDEFSFHANSGKNDFANWIEGVFEEKELALDVRQVANREETIQVLKEYLEEQEAPEEDAAVEKEQVEEEEKPQEDEEQEEKKESGGLEEKEGEPEERSGQDEDGKLIQESLVKFNVRTTRPHEQHAPALRDEEREELKVEAEHDLARNDVKDIVEDARQELEIEGRQVETKKQFHLFPKDDKFSFIVKEFIYGFILGLIFGLIMLGALLNVKV